MIRAPEEHQETGLGTRSRRTSLSGGMLGQPCVPSAGADKLDTFVRCCVVGPFSCTVNL